MERLWMHFPESMALVVREAAPRSKLVSSLASFGPNVKGNLRTVNLQRHQNRQESMNWLPTSDIFLDLKSMLRIPG